MVMTISSAGAELPASEGSDDWLDDGLDDGLGLAAGPGGASSSAPHAVSTPARSTQAVSASGRPMVGSSGGRTGFGSTFLRTRPPLQMGGHQDRESAKPPWEWVRRPCVRPPQPWEAQGPRTAL